MDEQNQSSSAANPDPLSAASQPITPVASFKPPVNPVDPSESSTPSAPQQPKQSSGSRFPWILFLVILLIGFLGLAMWYFTSQLQKTGSLASTPTPGASNTSPSTLIVGTDPTFQPMEYMQSGKMVGYDIDLANLLAKQIGTKITFKNITFDDLFTALQNHQIDLIISAVTITPERQKKYAFSEQYLNAGQVIITQKTNTVIKKPADLKGKKIGVQQGTTDESEALKFTANNLVIRFPDFIQATKALVSGDIDAIITDLPSAQGIVGTNPTLQIASDPITDDYYGIVFRKGDPEVDKVNKALDSLSVRGYLTELKHKWLD